MDQGLAEQFHLWWKPNKQWEVLWHAWISRTSKKKKKKGYFSPGVDEKQQEQRLEQNNSQNSLNKRLRMDPG